MRNCVYFDRMRVEHMQIGSCRCHKVTLAKYKSGGIVLKRYLFSERNYFLKIFTLQTFVLNQL